MLRKIRYIMSNEDDKEKFDNLIRITDLLIRVTALESLLIENGLIKKENLELKIGELTEKITKTIMNNIQNNKN